MHVHVRALAADSLVVMLLACNPGPGASLIALKCATKPYLPRNGPAHFCWCHIYETCRGDARLSCLVYLCKSWGSQLQYALICQNDYLILQQPWYKPY